MYESALASSHAHISYSDETVDETVKSSTTAYSKFEEHLRRSAAALSSSGNFEALLAKILRVVIQGKYLKSRMT